MSDLKDSLSFASESGAPIARSRYMHPPSPSRRPLVPPCNFVCWNFPVGCLEMQETFTCKKQYLCKFISTDKLVVAFLDLKQGRGHRPEVCEILRRGGAEPARLASESRGFRDDNPGLISNAGRQLLLIMIINMLMPVK